MVHNAHLFILSPAGSALSAPRLPHLLQNLPIALLQVPALHFVVLQHFLFLESKARTLPVPVTPNICSFINR